MKRRNKFLLCIATFLLSIAFCITGVTLYRQNFAQASDGALFESSYAYGETIKLPEHSVKVGDNEIVGTPVVLYPDGSAVSNNVVKLDMPGVYQVEYRATFAKKTYKDVYSFTVDYPLYVMSAKGDMAVYGKPQVPEGYQTTDGLIAKMSAGSTLQFNSIINLETITKNDKLFSFQILPTIFGARDCTDIIVRMEDASDSSNYVELRFQCSNEHLNVIYARIKGSNQKNAYGAHDGGETTSLHGEPFGFAALGSFYGYDFGTSNNELGLRYDKEKQIFYLDKNYVTGGSYLADLDNDPFEVPWRGFTSGKIRISFSGAGFIKNSYGLLITEMAQTDLSAVSLGVKPSDVLVDYGEYTSEEYPTAVVGQPYSIFPATTENLFRGEKLQVKVYQFYGSSKACNVDIVNGCFVPREASLHTIEYTSIDCFGNKKVLTIPVQVDESAQAISFTLDQTPITLGNGAYLTLPIAEDFVGGNGNLKLEVMLVNKTTNLAQTITEDTVRFTERGEYELIYKVSDYNTYYTEKKIDVTVGEGTVPHFIGEPFLPKYYIKGGKYALPTLQAEDYTLDEVQILQTTIDLKKNGETSFSPDGNYFVVPACNYVEVSFVAVDAKGNRDVLVRTVPVVDVGLDGSLNVAKYFQTVNGNVKAENKYLSLTTTNERADFSFIRELDGDNFSITTKVLEGKGGFDKIRITLTDYADKNKVVEIVLLNDNGRAYISVNGRDPVNTGNSMEDSVRTVELTLNKAALMYGTTTISVPTYLNGEAFKGFDDFVYLDISIEGVSSSVELQVSRLNRQALYNMRKDTIAPNIFFAGNYGGEQTFNSTVTIYPVYAVDVLNPYSEMTFSVVAPSGEYVVAKDGTTLKNVSSNDTYEFVIEEYGRYKCSYNYADAKGNAESFSYVMQVLDKDAPTIYVQKTTVNGKVGDTITVSGFEVTDNMSTKDKVVVSVQLISADGISVLSNTTADKKGSVSFKPTKAGVYTVRIFAFDENYNATHTDVQCIVR